MNSSKYSIVILEKAKNNLKDIVEYITVKLSNKEAAEKLIKDVFDSVEKAAMFPYALPKLKNKNITLNEYRRINIKNYALIYKIVEEIKEIRIMAIFYAPSNMSKLLDIESDD